MIEYMIFGINEKRYEYQICQTNILKNVGMLGCQNIGILEQKNMYLYNLL